MTLPKLISTMVLLTSIVLLQACTGKTVMLKNSTGDEVKCEVSTASAMLTGVLIRDSSMRSCIKEYKQQGYVQQKDVN